MRKSTSGFTIVELLIVVVVIAILAAISIVAYSGIQARAYDSRRVNDLTAIAKALELYKTDNGTYPTPASSGMGAQSSWESSAREAEGQFLVPLKSFGFESNVPVDPINDAIEATTSEAIANRSYGYAYYRYPAGSNGCDAGRGAFYVLGAFTTATVGVAKYPDSPGFRCSGRDWQAGFSWVTGGFEN